MIIAHGDPSNSFLYNVYDPNDYYWLLSRTPSEARDDFARMQGYTNYKEYSEAGGTLDDSEWEQDNIYRLRAVTKVEMSQINKINSGPLSARSVVNTNEKPILVRGLHVTLSKADVMEIYKGIPEPTPKQIKDWIENHPIDYSEMEDLDPYEFVSKESYDRAVEECIEIAKNEAILPLKRYILHYDANWPKSIIQRNMDEKYSDSSD